MTFHFKPYCDILILMSVRQQFGFSTGAADLASSTLLFINPDADANATVRPV